MTNKNLSLISDLRDRLKKLHLGFTPHDGQIEAGRRFFDGGVKVLFLQCGRNWGKSKFGTYCAVRHAALNPNSAIYIVGPKQKTQAEIIWHSGYLRNMAPRELLRPEDPFNQNQLRAWFDNGSFIKIDGSDNEDDLRGYKPDLLIIDEFKDWKRSAYQAMEPNLKAKNATVIILGTPPDAECFYTQMREWVMTESTKGNPRCFYMELPTSSNPHIDKELLEETRLSMVARGEEAIWEREYMARFVHGGALSIFPRFSTSGHVREPKIIRDYIEKDRHKLQWYCISDPGTATVFAVLFMAINPYTGQVFILDEIYERDRALCSTSQIWERIVKIADELYPEPEAWNFIYDEAAAWFANEVNDKYNVALMPTAKRDRVKENEISLIRDVMRMANKLVVSEECKNFIFEVRNYVTDEKGKYPRVNDHLIDAFRYGMAAANYELVSTLDPEVAKALNRDENPNRTFADDVKAWQKEADPFCDIDDILEIPEEDSDWTTLSDDL